MSTYEKLEAKRAAFKEFYDSSVAPVLQLSPEEDESLASEDVARRIEDPSVRRRYCELEIELLDANIEHYRADAQLLEPPERDAVTPVVSTLVVAAVVSYQWSLPAALLAAAGWYWLAHDTARRRHEQRVRHVLSHNEMAPGWEETIAGWEQSKAELLEVLRTTPSART